MAWHACLVATLLLVATTAGAAPISFESSGAADGFINPANSPPDAQLELAQSWTRTSWSIHGEDSAAASRLSGEAHSTVMDNSVGAEGSWDMTLSPPLGEYAFGSIAGDYGLSFTLTEPMHYSFSFFGHSDPPENSTQSATMDMFLTGPGFYFSELQVQGSWVFTPLPSAGVLVPGNYTLYVRFLGHASEGSPLDQPGPSHVTGRMNLELELAPIAVAEPASLLLVGPGLVALYRSRRRQLY